ncbi:pantetheine-phosphate adenylyltransferase [Spiroplasma culicicola]|uniref:Phosphopantetheine adenylyltransferase n=1 Tax=Spiroplasma culicicola AES-1 TaxID=1276246 RepID=W6A8D5_9MOLU|nr:pantetheine-phosphate adenylyltransferase [Spiroplasma culicicola]AHI53262.1 phosphopantetheine adenylyltransferase [Spiroplasma culicicola AES-1]
MEAIYAGSFNPFHEGHEEVLKKALRIFEKIYIVISKNIFKDQNPDLLNRIAEVKQKIKHLQGVEILINEDKLTADLAKEMGVKFLIRGVRNSGDLEYEIELSDANKSLYSDLETILFIADSHKREISSSRLKEIEKYKGEQ